MKIVIAGIRGYLGFKSKLFFQKKGYKVYDYKKKLPTTIDLILNLSGPPQAYCEKYPNKSKNYRAKLNEKLIKIANKKKAKKFIFASTEWVYGNLAEKLQKENDEIKIESLNSLYAITKAIGEKLILNKNKLKSLQFNSYKNFYLTNDFTSKLIDNYRKKLFLNSKFYQNKIRILHITNFNIRHNGRLFYNTGRRINNGFIKLGHTVQTFSDRDIISQDRKITDIYGSNSLNNRLFEIVGNFNPHLIVLGHADQISNYTLEQIRKFYPSIKFCQWFLDRMDNKNWKTNKLRFLSKIKSLDASFCTTHPSSLGNLKSKKIFFIPNPVDQTFENMKIYKNKVYKYDLFFAISHGVHRGILRKGKIDKRESFILKLMNGNNQIKFNIFGMKNNQPVWAEEFKNELSKSKMALNLSQGNPLKFYSSDRLAQLIGNGILTFVDVRTQLNKLFSKKEVVFYKNNNDLINKIIKFKNSDKLRNKIAYQGMKKYHTKMNSEKIAHFIVNKTLNINTKLNFFWENK